MPTKENFLAQLQTELDAALQKRRAAYEAWIRAGEELEAVRRKIARYADEKKI